MIPRVYIAGPYTAVSRSTRALHVQRAESVGALVLRAGCYPVIPHLTGFRLEHVNSSYEFWVTATKQELQTCDACVMVHGWHWSNGSQGEHTDCLVKGRPVFESWRDAAERVFLPDEFYSWVRGALKGAA